MTFNWLEILAEGAGITTTELADFITKGGQVAGNPEAAAKANALLAAEVEASKLSDVALLIPGELKDILALKFSPRDRPSDGLG